MLTERGQATSLAVEGGRRDSHGRGAVSGAVFIPSPLNLSRGRGTVVLGRSGRSLRGPGESLVITATED